MDGGLGFTFLDFAFAFVFLFVVVGVSCLRFGVVVVVPEDVIYLLLLGSTGR